MKKEHSCAAACAAALAAGFSISVAAPAIGERVAAALGPDLAGALLEQLSVVSITSIEGQLCADESHPSYRIGRVLRL